MSRTTTDTLVNMSLPIEKTTSALQEAVSQFVAANPKSERIFNYASLHLPAGNTRTTIFSAPFPLSIVRASDCTVVSADGGEYLDMIGEFTAGIYGHSHPLIVKALQEGLTKGVNFGGTSPMEGELASLIKERFEVNSGLEMMRFTNSGTEANLLAVALARVWSGRTKVLVFANAYHGSLQSFKAKIEPMNVPGDYILAKYNSIASVESILSQLDPDSLAAILVEPMQGAGGSFPASKKFLNYLRGQASRLNTLLIFDEVMTSRLHYAGGLSGKYGIKPDLITMGKYLGGGMSFGMFGGRKDLMCLFDPRAGGPTNPASNSKSSAASMMLVHSGTFNNNVLSMYGGIAGAKILTAKVLEDLNALGDYLRVSVNQLLQRRQILPASVEENLEEPDIDLVPRGMMWMSGIGSINSVHFGINDEAAELRELFYFHMIEHGIYLAKRGFVTLTIKHTKADIDRFVSAVDAFVSRWATIMTMKT